MSNEINRVVVHGFQSFPGQREPGGTIIIEGCFPDEPAPSGDEPLKDWQERAVLKFEVDAQAVYDVLANNLPGGTMHQLLIKMLQRQLNLFVTNLK